MSTSSFQQTTGGVRRSQAVFTYGIGAVVDLAKGSFMPLGLQHMDWQWSRLPQEVKDAIVVHEPRLQRLLEVRAFRSMPVPGDRQLSEFGERVKREWTIPCTRFPEWLQCPGCDRLGTVDDPFEVQPNLLVKCPRCDRETTPVRFVVACRRGHVDDFPWVDWAHGGGACDRPKLFLRSRGQSAALGDLYVECDDCSAPLHSLADIFDRKAMSGHVCNGRRPWLMSDENCQLQVETLQRGASNIHFPVSASMLSIPPASEAVAKLLEREWDWIKSVPESALPEVMSGFIENRGLAIRPDTACDWIRRRRGIDAEDALADEREARLQEYEALSTDCPPDPAGTELPEFENETFLPPEEIAGWFDLIAAVRRLREVRAYCGFTRIEPRSLPIEQIRPAIRSRAISPLKARDGDWLPAIETRGEGIFLRFREETIQQWVSENDAVRERAEMLNGFLQSQSARGGLEAPHQISPRLLLVHSFSHVLIRRLSLDCGYSSASLRERLFVSEDPDAPMLGLLIYTASADSDGSLGGLVSLATPDRIADIVCRAIRDADWCGNDPVCIETDPNTAGDRLCGASCHNCLLVSETSCEKFNRELDRALLVGGVDGMGRPLRGFFE